MGATSENRIKFNRSNLKLIENRVNRGEFTKETYVHDTDSRLVVKVKLSLSYSDCTFCLYSRIGVKGDAKSKTYKRNIIKVSEARNA